MNIRKMNLVAISDVGSYKYPTVQQSIKSYRKYPEFNDDLIDCDTSPVEDNKVYSAVRNCFVLLGLDKDNIGKKIWNPLGEIIKPGNCVLLKPNMVMDINPLKDQGVECLYTQSSVLVPVIDYVVRALGGRGKIIIGDAPMQECDFEKLIQQGGYKEIVNHYKEEFEKSFENNLTIELVDFRQLRSTADGLLRKAVIDEKKKGIIVDLGKTSHFCDIDEERLKNIRITNYDPRILTSHHTADKHEYYVSPYVLQSDVIINLPKPKTHRKAGVTIALKNLVGITARKEYLPHHTVGDLDGGNGDEYKTPCHLHALRSRIIDIRNIHMSEHRYGIARVENLCIRILSKLLRLFQGRGYYQEGSWYGNHTISKTINDLNRILLFADKNGVMHDTPIRNMMIIADMVVSGEKEGPICPSRKNVGIVAAGFNPVCFDEAIATIMGFDIKKIPTLTEARSYDYLVEKNTTPIVVSDFKYWDRKNLTELQKEKNLGYLPTLGWKGHIEI